MKAIPLLVISIPPFANYLALFLMWVSLKLLLFHFNWHSFDLYTAKQFKIIDGLKWCPSMFVLEYPLTVSQLYIFYHPSMCPSSLCYHPVLFTARYFFPRQLLVPYFWTPKQQVEFRALYHSNRVRQHRPVLKGLENTSQQVKDGQLQSGLKALCAKVSERIRALWWQEHCSGVWRCAEDHIFSFHTIKALKDSVFL